MSNENIATAIDNYRTLNGVQWKSKLKKLFFSGKNRSPELQYFRNHHLSVLDKIKYNTGKREIVALLDK